MEEEGITEILVVLEMEGVYIPCAPTPRTQSPVHT